MKRNILSIVMLLSVAAAMKANNESLGAIDNNWYRSGGEGGAYQDANDLQNRQDYDPSSALYAKGLAEKKGSERDQRMATLNLATNETGEGKPGPGWSEFDTLHNMKKSPKEQSELAKKQFPRDHKLLKGKTVVVTEDIAGIGDDFHFFGLLELLSEKGCSVILSMSKGFLIGTLQGATKRCNTAIVNVKNFNMKDADIQTHVFALLGHLGIKPEMLRPTKIMHYPVIRDDGTDPIDLVAKPVDAILSKNPNTEVIFFHMGEACRSAVVPGGKKLFDRHINPKAINSLLRKYKHLYLIDMGAGSETTKFTPDEDVAHDEEGDSRVVPLARDKAFDTILAAGIVMRYKDRTMLLKADNGPGNVPESNVGGECPDTEIAAADRSVTIVPGQHDWRVNGDEKTSDDYKKFYAVDNSGNKIEIGDRYRHRIAAGLVYRAKSRANEAAIIEQAYRDVSTVRRRLINKF